MLNYLLYIIIQKGIPAIWVAWMLCSMRGGWGFMKEGEGEEEEGVSGRDYIGLCYRELCLQWCPLIAVFSAEQSGT